MAQRGRPKSRAGRTAPKRSQPSTEDYRALAAFRYALRRFLDFSQGAARGVGLTPQQHQALLSIVGYPGRDTVTVGELAERMLLKHHSTVELVDRLVELGLVRRKTDPTDRRRVLLSLTAKSRKLLTSLSATHFEELRRIRPVFATLLQRLEK
jgi:DNA-binding MarR family transcriptional regulator